MGRSSLRKPRMRVWEVSENLVERDCLCGVFGNRQAQRFQPLHFLGVNEVYRVVKGRR